MWAPLSILERASSSRLSTAAMSAASFRVRSRFSLSALSKVVSVSVRDACPSSARISPARNVSTTDSSAADSGCRCSAFAMMRLT